MNDKVEVELRVMTKNGNFWVGVDVGRGHCAPSEETDVAGVEEERVSSSDSG